MLSLWPGAADAFRSVEETRVHRAAWWRGGSVAAGGTRAAAGDAGYRLPRRKLAFGLEQYGGRVSAAPARAGLDRGPHRCDRISMGRRAGRTLCRDRG